MFASPTLRPARLLRFARLRVAASALALIAAFALIGAAHARAATWPSSLQSASTVTLPAGATVPNNVEDTYLTTTPPNQRVLVPAYAAPRTACDASADCVSISPYTDANNNTSALIIPIQDGVAGRAAVVQLPAGAASSNQDAGLNAVACSPSGACAAVGYYLDSGGVTQAMVVPISNGVPHAAIEVDPGGYSVYLSGVSCQTNGQCVAVGGDAKSNSAPEITPEIVTINGKHIVASSDTSALNGVLMAVSCSASNTCTAVGAQASPSILGMVQQIVNGAPGTPATLGSSQQAQMVLTSVSCPATGACLAAGIADQTDDLQAVSVTGGVPGTAESIPLVAQQVFTGIACWGDGRCDLTVTSTSPGTGYVILVTNGQPATLAISAPNVTVTPVYGLACIPGSCLGAGKLGAAGPPNSIQPILVPITGGAVGTGMSSAVPAALPAAAYEDELTSVGCTPSGSCVALGYGESLTPPQTTTPYLLSAQAPLTVDTASLPGGSQGAGYSATLGASGAWGSYSWSIRSGSLPAGLRLDASSGVISGRPSTSGTATFTVAVTGTGNPAQTATRTFSVNIAAPPVNPTPPVSAAPPVNPTPPVSAAPPVNPTPSINPALSTAAARPHVNLFAGKLNDKRGRVHVTLRCGIGAACHGTVTIQRRETVIKHRGKRTVRKHKLVTVGHARFSAAAGHVKTVLVRLNARGRKLLARKRHANVKAHAKKGQRRRASTRLGVRLSAHVRGGNTARRNTSIVPAKTKAKHTRPKQHHKPKRR